MKAASSRLAISIAIILSAGLAACGNNEAPVATPAPPTETAPTPPVNPLPPPSLSGNLLPDVPPRPPGLTPTDSRPWFDVYAWQTFIALNWPAQDGPPGHALDPDDPAKFAQYDGTPGPVWTTWRSATDLYPGPGNTPLAWDQNAPNTVCTNFPHDKRMVLRQFQKSGETPDGFNEAFAGPLPDQTSLWTLYQIQVNQIEYDFVRDNGYYDQAKWPADGVVFPASSATQGGAIEIKSSWRNLAKVPAAQQSRFFVINGLGVIPQTCSGDPDQGSTQSCECEELTLGLVGFHFAAKTATFPQWVWATFEQVDNVELDPTAPAGTQLSYHDPAAPPNPAEHPGYSTQPIPFPDNPKDPQPSNTPVNVTRLDPIPTTPAVNSTVALNQTYRQFLAGTPWTNYQLILTQWPSDPKAPPVKVTGTGCDAAAPQTSKSSGAPFPACQVANATMETYLQNDSCMNCHYSAGSANAQGQPRADFSWILDLRSQPASPTPAPTGGASGTP